MTLIIAAVTSRGVLMASDRRITSIARGDVLEDDRCKMVDICGQAAVGYTGLAELDGLPTHEWVCHKLVDANARRPSEALEVLRAESENAFARLPAATPMYPHTYLMVGFEDFVSGGVGAFTGIVTNMCDSSGQALAAPVARFSSFVRRRQTHQCVYLCAIGAGFPDALRKQLWRSLQSAVKRQVSDEALVALLARSIVDVSHRPVRGVGERVLTVAMPRAVSAVGGGKRFMVAGPGQSQAASFGYLVPGEARVRQYGPAFACGRYAHVNLETSYDPVTGAQSSEIKILRLPEMPERDS